MASVTVNLTGYILELSIISWDDDVFLGSTFSADGTNQTLISVLLYGSASALPGTAHLSIAGSSKDFTPEFEATGRIIFTASDGEMLEIAIANADMVEPYTWLPTNSLAVGAFADHIQGLTDQNATLTLTDDLAPSAAPSFFDDTGNAQTWIVGSAIAPITVPGATGVPAPTYAVVGVLPDGISFNSTTRVLSGTPTVAGSGEIRIQATNSEGTDDWAVAYTVLAGLSLASFDSTGLEVVAAALLEASAPGTSGSTPYADSDRGGTDTPLEGELGLGDSETVISRISHVGGSALRLNDNDNPSALHIGDYFNAGGDGSDLTLYLQTVDDGLVSFPILLTGGNNAGVVRISLPTAGVALLNNISTGDRWIFALARISVATQDSNWSDVISGLETIDGEWSDVTTELTTDSEWSTVVSGLETTDSEWSTVASGTVETADSEWSTVVSGLETADGEWSVVAGIDPPPVGATRQFTLLFVNGFWSASPGDPGILVDPSLIAGGATAYLTAFGIDTGFDIILRLSPTADGAGSEIGPQLTSEIEISSSTFQFLDSNGDTEFTLPGPNYPGNTSLDEIEPYAWLSSGFGFYNFQNVYNGTRTFIIDDAPLDSEWSNLDSFTPDTVHSEWSVLAETDTQKSEWSALAATPTEDSEWSVLFEPPSGDSEWSTLTGGIGRTGVGFLATPVVPMDHLIAVDQIIGSYEADVSWAGQANHVYLDQVRTRWVARVDKSNGPAPNKAAADAWAESTNRAVVGAFQYIDVISRNPSQIEFGPVVLFDQMLDNPNFADATLWVMARLEVDDALKDSAPAPGTFSPFYVLTQRDSSQTVFSLFRGSEDEWCVGQMALQPDPSWEVVVTVAGIQDLYTIPFQYQVATESIDLVLTTVVAQFGFILHAVNFVSDGSILFRRAWNSPPEFPAGSFGPFVITNTDTTLIVDPILNCP